MGEMTRSHKKEPPVADPKKAHGASEEELALAQAMIEARNRAGLTQSEVARRIKTSQSVVARLERGASMPSTRTLQRFARATGSRLSIRFERIEGR